jgi:hypothetical protein
MTEDIEDIEDGEDGDECAAFAAGCGSGTPDGFGEDGDEENDDAPPFAGFLVQTAIAPPSKASKTRERLIFRRYKSELRMEELFDWEFEPGAAYHCITQGDIDALTFLRFILRQQPLRYFLLSTWCMGSSDCEELERWLRLGRIGRMDTYVGETFRSVRLEQWESPVDMHRNYGGRIVRFRNHSKTMVGFGPKFDFVLSSSANVNENQRTESTVITANSELAHFYKEYFDGIVSFETEFQKWAPFECAGTAPDGMDIAK